MPAPYLTGSEPVDQALQSAKLLDRYLGAAIDDLTQRGTTMSNPTGGFVASIRSMLDSARADLEQAKADGVAKVGEAIDEMKAAKEATVKVAGSVAQAIKDEAAEVMRELGQITNHPPE